MEIRRRFVSVTTVVPASLHQPRQSSDSVNKAYQMCYSRHIADKPQTLSCSIINREHPTAPVLLLHALKLVLKLIFL